MTFILRTFNYDLSESVDYPAKNVRFNKEEKVLSWVDPTNEDEYEVYVDPSMKDEEFDGMEVISVSYLMNSAGENINKFGGVPYKRERE